MSGPNHPAAPACLKPASASCMLSMLQAPFGTFEYLTTTTPKLEPVFTCFAHARSTRDFMYSTVREMLQPECIMRTQEGCVEMRTRVSSGTYCRYLGCMLAFDSLATSGESVSINQVGDRLFCLDTVQIKQGLCKLPTSLEFTRGFLPTHARCAIYNKSPSG